MNIIISDSKKNFLRSENCKMNSKIRFLVIILPADIQVELRVTHPTIIFSFFSFIFSCFCFLIASTSSKFAQSPLGIENNSPRKKIFIFEK